MLNKVSAYGKDNIGIVLVVEKRYPLRLFTREPVKIYYRPDLTGAGWYKINVSLVDVEEFLEKDHALEVMALLRQREAAELVDIKL